MAVPDHSTFSKNRHGRFRESDLLRQVFDTTVRRCMAEGLVGGDGFAVDASMIKADANRQRSVPGSEWQCPEGANHAVREYLSVLDDAAFGAATPVVPKFICPAGKELRKRQKIYRVPRPLVDEDGMMRYRASKLDCESCPLKPHCCPTAPARKIPRSIHEGARDMARDIAATDAYVTSRRERKKVEMLFAHLKRILRLDRLRLRGPNGARDEFHLAAIAQNLRKLAMLIPVPAPIAST